jgi:hypothetical protein
MPVQFIRIKMLLLEINERNSVQCF